MDAGSFETLDLGIGNFGIIYMCSQTFVERVHGYGRNNFMRDMNF